MKDVIKLVWSNFKFIIAKSDLTSMRLALYTGALMWSIWVVVVLLVFPEAANDYDLEFVDSHLQFFAFLFFAYGGVGAIALLLKQQHRGWITIGSMFGALLWTISLDLIVLVRLSEHTLPMGSAHFLAASIAWWIFIRDIFSKDLHE